MTAALPSSGTDGTWISNLADLETPVPLVDLDRLERNLDRMAAYAAAHGLALRPHTKTHKSPRVGAEQLRRGAVGLTCATPLEAEVMSEVCDDILLAYQAIGTPKLQRLMALPDQVRLTVAVDSPDAVEQLARAAQERGRTVGVYVELDLGMHRVGVGTPEEMLRLTRLVAARPPLEYRGIMFYPGHIRSPVGQQGKDLERLASSLRDALELLDRSGLPPSVVSGGSTPTVWDTDRIAGLTEIRPGTYVYNDRTTVQVGACDWNDCAVTVLASVVSTAVPGQAVVDAGSKALGAGAIPDRRGRVWCTAGSAGCHRAEALGGARHPGSQLHRLASGGRRAGSNCSQPCLHRRSPARGHLRDTRRHNRDQVADCGSGAAADPWLARSR